MESANGLKVSVEDKHSERQRSGQHPQEEKKNLNQVSVTPAEFDFLCLRGH